MTNVYIYRQLAAQPHKFSQNITESVHVLSVTPRYGGAGITSCFSWLGFSLRWGCKRAKTCSYAGEMLIPHTLMETRFGQHLARINIAASVTCLQPHKLSTCSMVRARSLVRFSMNGICLIGHYYTRTLAPTRETNGNRPTSFTHLHRFNPTDEGSARFQDIHLLLHQ